MSAYKLTGYHSHRHPFLGSDVDSVDWPVIDPVGDFDVVESLAADPEPKALDWRKVARPIVWGCVTGLVAYATARSFTGKKEARQIGFVLAGLNVLGGLASDWIAGEMKTLTASTGLTVTEPKT